MSAATGTALEVDVDQAYFKRAIDTVARAISTRSLPICRNIAIDTQRGILRLRATDLDIGITATCGAIEGDCRSRAFVAKGEDVFAFRTRIEAEGWVCIDGAWVCARDSRAHVARRAR